MEGCVLSLTLKRLRRRLWLLQKDAEGKCRFYIYNEAQHECQALVSSINWYLIYIMLRR